jgi:hypothetical protein
VTQWCTQLFCSGGGRCSTNSVENCGQRAERTGIWGGSPLDRGSAQFACEWTRSLIRLLRMYCKRNWEFGSALSKLWNFGAFKPPTPLLLRYATEVTGQLPTRRRYFARKGAPIIFWIGGRWGTEFIRMLCGAEKYLAPASNQIPYWVIPSSLFACFQSRRLCNSRLSNTFTLSSSSYSSF